MTAQATKRFWIGQALVWKRLNGTRQHCYLYEIVDDERADVVFMAKDEYGSHVYLVRVLIERLEAR